jgi:hypothetical protein
MSMSPVDILYSIWYSCLKYNTVIYVRVDLLNRQNPVHDSELRAVYNCMSYIKQNDWISMNKELKRMRKKVALACFKIMTQ